MAVKSRRDSCSVMGRTETTLTSHFARWGASSFIYFLAATEFEKSRVEGLRSTVNYTDACDELSTFDGAVGKTLFLQLRTSSEAAIGRCDILR